MSCSWIDKHGTTPTQWPGSPNLSRHRVLGALAGGGCGGSRNGGGGRNKTLGSPAKLPPKALEAHKRHGPRAANDASTARGDLSNGQRALFSACSNDDLGWCLVCRSSSSKPYGPLENDGALARLIEWLPQDCVEWPHSSWPMASRSRPGDFEELERQRPATSTPRCGHSSADPREPGPTCL